MKSAQNLIMPSFNDFLGGRPMNDTARISGEKAESIAGPVLRSKAVEMGTAETYLLDGTYLGTIEQLKSLS